MDNLNDSVARPSFGYRIAKALPTAVALMSTFALPNGIGTAQLASANYPSLAVSAIGIAGTALYFLRKRSQQSVEPILTSFWVWALLQLPVATLASQSTPTLESPLWSTGQFFSLPLYIIIKTDAGNLLRFGINFFPVVLFAWIRRLRVAENFNK
jgi:hypothetical protein